LQINRRVIDIRFYNRKSVFTFTVQCLYLAQTNSGGTLMAAITSPHGSKSATSNSKPAAKHKIYYPTGDGKPMAEDALHRKLMAYCCDALEFHFANRPDFYVAGNDFVYYEEGNAQARVSPDSYVVIGVPKRLRHFYKIWEEDGIAPAVIFEFTSKKTRKDDVTFKKPLYEQVLRVQEYFQFDPTGDYLVPRLQGQRLQSGSYEAIELRDNRMWSEHLQLELVIAGEDLRFYDPAQGEWLRTYEEAETERQAETARAENERERADSESQRAEAEARRAEAAETELARLRAEIDALRREK
jgi:Uma2 family endonuclease